MKRIILLILAVLCVCPPIRAQGTSGTITAAASDCRPSNCVAFVLPPNSGAVGVQLTGTFTATAQFEGSLSLDGSYVSVSATPIGSTTPATSATSTGVWQIASAGIVVVRVRGSSYTSGTINVLMYSSSTMLARGGSGGGGGGTVTGSGSTNTVPLWSSATGLTDSIFTQPDGSSAILTGTLAVTDNTKLAASKYLNWGATFGTAGYGLRDNAGTIEFKNSGGAWAGVGSGAGSITGSGTSGEITFWTSGTALSSDNGLAFDSTTNALSTGSLSLTTPLTVANGGSGAATFASNGVLLGNGASAFGVTAQGGANTVLIANAGTPSFSAAITVGTSITTPLLRPTSTADTALAFTGTGGGMTFGSTGKLNWSNNASGAAGTIDTIIKRGAASTLYFGNASGTYSGEVAFGDVSHPIGSLYASVATVLAINSTTAVSVGNSNTAIGSFRTGNDPSGGIIAARNAADGADITVLTLDSSDRVVLAAGLKVDNTTKNVLLPASDYLNFGTIIGTSGYGFRDNAGTMEFKNSGGSWGSFGAGGGSITGSSTSGYVTYWSAASTIAGDQYFTWNSATHGLTVNTINTTSLTLATALGVSSGGTGAGSFTTNGVLYGSGTGNFGVTAQGGANTVLVANAGTPSFSATPTLTSLTTTGSITPGTNGVVPRVVSAADATSITPNTDNADVTTQANTQSAGTLTINADGGTPVNGRRWILRIKSTNVQSLAWDAQFRGALPVATGGGSNTDYYGFIYNAADSKWDITSGVGTPPCDTANIATGVTTFTTATSGSVIAAAGASTKNYVYSAQVSNTGVTNVLITWRDGSGGTVLGYTAAPAGYSSTPISFMVPLVTTANTALFADTSAASTTVYVGAQACKGP